MKLFKENQKQLKENALKFSVSAGVLIRPCAAVLCRYRSELTKSNVLESGRYWNRNNTDTIETQTANFHTSV